MSNKEENNFNFSVVMAVYNVGYYLKEAIDSLINQTLSFEENIQLILVDDGSLDNSLEIAQEYQEKYPKNIIVLSKENGGVSSARNLGLKYATGKYVNFMDSDDIVSPNTFEEEPHFYQCYTTTSFIKNEAIGDIEFDTSLIHFEDAVFINKILMKKMKYGLVKGATYYYRKRFSQQLTNSASSKKEFFTDRFKYAYMELINESIEKFGYFPKYLQKSSVYCKL